MRQRDLFAAARPSGYCRSHSSEQGRDSRSTKSGRRDRFAKAILILAVTGGAFAAGLAYAAQPHRKAALNALLTAQTGLRAAEHNKGGPRGKALDLVDRAIQQVRPGIAAGAI